MAEARHFDPEGMAPPGGRYSQVVKWDKLVFIAGQTAVDDNGNVVGKGSMEAQTRQVYANLTKAVVAAGGTPASIVKTTTYITDRENIPGYRAGRQEMWPKDPPTSTLLIISGLANPDYLIEVEAIAVVDG